MQTWDGMVVKTSAIRRLHCLFVEIQNEHSVVCVNKGFVICYLHVNNLLHCLGTVTVNKVQVAFTEGVCRKKRRTVCFDACYDRRC